MRRIAMVRRRDGETVPFEQPLLVDAVHRALLAAGSEDRLLADEIAAVVGLFLEKTFCEEIPSTAQVADMVEKVLVETGYAAAAKAFILHRERLARLREADEAQAVRDLPELFDHRLVWVDDAAAGRSDPFSREAVARAIAADGVLDRREADDVAVAVEQRIRRAGVSRLPASLVRAFAEVEVFDRRLPIDLRARGGAVVRPEDIASSLHRPRRNGGGHPPRRAAAELGGKALRCHALSDLLPVEVAQAHLAGDLHIHGLESPSSLASVCVDARDVAEGAVVGGGSRDPGAAVEGPRRLTATLGRVARIVEASVAGGVTVAGLTAAVVPPDGEAPHVAWDVIQALSADPGCRPPWLEVCASGERTAEFGIALLRAHARGAGLPPRSRLPRLEIPIGDDTLADPRSAALVSLAAEAVLRGERVRFPLGGRGAQPSGTYAVAGRVTLNLPRAAHRVGRGACEAFLRHLDQLVELAIAAHRSRRELVAQVGTAPGGCMAALLRGTRGRSPLVDLASARWSVGILGLNEAVAHLTGFELHEADDAGRRLAARIVQYLALRARECGLTADFHASLDADHDGRVAARLLEADRRSDPVRLNELLPGRDAYTAGVGVRRDAPVDVLLRAEREEPLHAHLDSATLVLPVGKEESGGPVGLEALLRSCLGSGRARAVEFRTW